MTATMASMNGGVMPMDHGSIDLNTLNGQERQSQGSLKTGEWFSFFGGGGGQKKTTRDGQQPKRRGPKPDSKPALTRRQELNRQAQRTHRERKEQYMRSLETEVSRLREAYTHEISAANLTVHQHREMVQSLSDENNILKEILAAHGIAYQPELARRKAERPHPGYHQSSPFASSSVGSQPNGLAPSNSNIYTTPPTTVSISSGVSPPSANGSANGIEHVTPPPHAPHAPHISPHVDISPMQELSPPQPTLNGALPCDALAVLDRIAPANRKEKTISGVFELEPQLQIDFILTLESPCREHTDYLCRRSITEADDEDMPFSGHALMATCPPPSYIANTTNEQIYPHKAPDLPHANLSTLLNLSRQLVTDGQITPIMALQHLKNHELYRTLTRSDVRIIIETLNTKVRCYGFGAVVEDFELMDCLSSVLGGKVDIGISQTGDDVLYS